MLTSYTGDWRNAVCDAWDGPCSLSELCVGWLSCHCDDEMAPTGGGGVRSAPHIEDGSNMHGKQGRMCRDGLGVHTLTACVVYGRTEAQQSFVSLLAFYACPAGTYAQSPGSVNLAPSPSFGPNTGRYK